MTFEQKFKAYELSKYITDTLIPCYPEGFFLNLETLSTLDNCVFVVQYKNLIRRFHFPITPAEIYSWISENYEIILSGKYHLKGWKCEGSYLLAPVLIKQNCEVQLINIFSNSFQKAA